MIRNAIGQPGYLMQPLPTIPLRKKSTNFSPFELVFGRKVKVPLEPTAALETEELEAREFYELHKAKWSQMRELARMYNTNAQDSYKHQYDKGAKPVTFKVGDKVRLAIDHPPSGGRKKKLAANYQLGWRVVDVSEHSAKIRHLDGREETVTVQRLRLDCSEDPTTDQQTPKNSESTTPIEKLDKSSAPPASTTSNPNEKGEISSPENDPSNESSTSTQDNQLLLNSPNQHLDGVAQSVNSTANDSDLHVETTPITTDKDLSPQTKELLSLQTVPGQKRNKRGRPKKDEVRLPMMEERTPTRASARLQQKGVIRRLASRPLIETNATNLSTYQQVIIYAMLLLYSMNLPSNAIIFPRRDPINWAKTEKVVVRDTVEIDYFMYYESPCEVLKKFSNNEEITMNCALSYTNSFIKPLDRFCTTVRKPTELFRTKRAVDPVSIGIIASTIIVGVVQGVMEHIRKSKVQALDEKRKLTEVAVADLEEKVSELNLKLTQLDIKTQRSIAFMSQLSVNLLWIRHSLESTARRWKKDQSIDRDFFSALNISLPCDECQPELMFTKECVHDPSDQTVFFTFSAMRPEKDLKVFKAIPFDLYEETEEGFCRFEFNGPPLAIWYPIERKACMAKEQQLTSSIVECLSTNPSNLFQQRECYKQLYPGQVVQLQYSPWSVMVYCWPFNISINGQSNDCAPWVIEIPAGVPFSIAGHAYNHSKMRFSGHPNFTPDWTFAINTGLTDHQDGLALSHRKTQHTKFWMFVVGFTLLCITILGVVAVTYKRRPTIRQPPQFTSNDVGGAFEAEHLPIDHFEPMMNV